MKYKIRERYKNIFEVHQDVAAATSKKSALINKLMENTLYINPPRKLLFKFNIGLSAALWIILTLSTGFFLCVTVPLLFIWIYYFAKFLYVWSFFLYLKRYPIIFQVVVAMLSVFFAQGVRDIMVFIIEFIFSIIAHLS